MSFPGHLQQVSCIKPQL